MAVIVEDPFTVASDTNLQDHTPSTTGDQWVQEFNDSTAKNFVVEEATDDLDVGNEASVAIIVTSRPNPTVVEYDIEMNIKSSNYGADTRPFILIARFTDTSNMYGLGNYRSPVAADAKIWKLVSGTPTELASGDTGWANGVVIKAKITDATKKLFKDAAEILSSSDNALTSAGRAGIGGGDVFVSGDGLPSSGQWDDYKVTETSAAGLSIPVAMHNYRRRRVA